MFRIIRILGEFLQGTSELFFSCTREILGSTIIEDRGDEGDYPLQYDRLQLFLVV